ncbi:hypothetical protein ACOZ38_09070 [Sphaerisporangium viridialbum]|uniref:hypothetical protein n=1 Tax=Sphaerisporangium viridialbum TaxID=46189 RepID=UPI003C77BC3D
MINDRSLFAYIGAAVTAGALMALPLPAQANSHAGTSNGAHARLTFPSTPDGGGGGGGEEEAPAAKKPRKEIRKHHRIRYVAHRPRKHHEHFHQPQPRENVDVSVDSEHGGGGDRRHHWGNHGHHHNNHFADDLYRTRHLRRFHSYREAREALIRDANRWFRHKSEKAHPKRVKGHDDVRVMREEPSARRDSGRQGD